MSTLISVNEMKKCEKGELDYRTDREGLIVIRWNDNSVVTVGSTEYGVEPLKGVQRWSAAEQKRVTVKCPDAIQKYNKSMGELIEWIRILGIIESE